MTPFRPGPPGAFTIASNNFLALARVFAESYRQHHPGAEVVVAVADRRAPQIDYASLPFRVVFAEELGIAAFPSLAFRYDILELNTAIKAFVFRWLRDRAGWDRALYFDPDILVTSPLPELDRALGEAQAALTPHLTAPIDDELRPSERQIRMMGIYNLGFAALRLDDSTRDFLDWWQRRLERFCLVDPHHGLFVDQGWMDFAPAFLDRVEILRSPRLNVAYWNLGQRDVERHGDEYRVGGEPLGFVHWSGIAIQPGEAAADRLSRHQNRVDLADRPVLRDLLASYRARVLAAGHRDFAEIPYGFDRFRPSGVAIPRFLRRTLLRLDPFGRRFTDPFDDEAPDGFYRWLAEPLRFPLGTLNRAALSLWESRPELVARFRGVVHDALPDFVEWLRANAGPELPPELIEGNEAGPEFVDVFVPFQQEPLRPFLQLTSEAQPDALEGVDLGAPGAWGLWLLEPFPGAGERTWLTRLAMLLWEKSPALQRAFPSPLHRDLDELAAWVAWAGESELGLASTLAETLRERLPEALRARPPRPLPGNVSTTETAGETYATAPAESGGATTLPSGPRLFGVQLLAARSETEAKLADGTAAALAEGGVPWQRIDLDAELLGTVVDGFVAPAAGAPFPVTLSHVALRLAPWRMGWLPAGVSQGGCRVGYLDWEIGSVPPSLRDHLRQWDVIWAASRFALEAIQGATEAEVRWVPPCLLGRSANAPAAAIRDANAPLVIVARFDATDPSQLDDPWSVVEAARRLEALAPPQSWRIRLHIRGVGPGSDPVSPAGELLAALRAAAAGLPVDFELSAGSLAASAVLADAGLYLDLSRSGRFSRHLVDAIDAGVPVVALAHGARRDWLDAESGYPVRGRLARLGGNRGPIPGSTLTAEADPADAAAALARALAAPEERAARTAIAARRVETLYGRIPATARILRELDRIRLRLAATPVPAGG